MVSVAEASRDDAVSPHVEEVPLRPRLSLHLHRPHEPPHPHRTGLVTVDLRYEVVLQEVLVVHRVVIEVSVVVPGVRLMWTLSFCSK